MTTGPTTTTKASNNANTNSSGSSTTNLSGTNNTTGTTANQSQTTNNSSFGGGGATGAWAPSQPLLQTQLDNISALQGSGAPNAAMTAGLTGVTDAAATNAGLNPGIVSDATGMLNGGGFGAANPDVKSAYSAASGALSPELSSDFLDFNKNPQIQELENTVRDQVQNAVGGEFAAAGRGGPNTAQFGAPNGQYAGTIAKNITQGLAAPLLGEYNTLLGTQQGAANELSGAANNESGALNASAQGSLGAETAAPSFLASDMNPANATFTAGQTGELSPLMYQGAVNQDLMPIAGSGNVSSNYGSQSGSSNTNSTGQSTSNNTVNMMQNATNQNRSNSTGSSTGSSTTTTPVAQTVLGTGTSLLGAWLGSDPRMKKDAAPVGMLFDGTPVHKFKYKGSDTTRIGLMSPQVQQRNPAAVKTGKDGLQRVNYDLATRRSVAQSPMLGGGY